MWRSVGLLLVSGSLLLAAPSRADDSPAPPSSPEAEQPEAVKGAFLALVKLGDDAKARGRLTDATRAYIAALKLQNDPTIRGRLGLIGARLEVYDRAAQDLINAIERGGGKDEDEKRLFAQTLLTIRPRICYLVISGNAPEAEVLIDDQRLGVQRPVRFKTFVMPGHYVVRGHSAKYGEASKEVDCPKGREGRAELTWEIPEATDTVTVIEMPAPPQESPKAPPATVERAMTIVDQRKWSNDDRGSPYEPPRDERARGGNGNGARWSVGAGPALVLGAASWLPSFGASLSGSVRVGAVSVDLDVRGAWLTGSIGGEPIRAMTGGALLSGCGHWRWVFGCVTGHLGVIRVEAAVGRYDATEYTFVKPGLGVRAGAEIPLGDTLGLRLAVDAVGLTAATRIWVGPATYADQPPILIGTTATGVWRF